MSLYSEDPKLSIRRSKIADGLTLRASLMISRSYDTPFTVKFYKTGKELTPSLVVLSISAFVRESNAIDSTQCLIGLEHVLFKLGEEN